MSCECTGTYYNADTINFASLIGTVVFRCDALTKYINKIHHYRVYYKSARSIDFTQISIDIALNIIWTVYLGSCCRQCFISIALNIIWSLLHAKTGIMRSRIAVMESRLCAHACESMGSGLCIHLYT